MERLLLRAADGGGKVGSMHCELSLLARLPDDVLETILLYALSNEGHLVHLKCVSKRLKKLLDRDYNQETIWRNIIIHAFFRRSDTVAAPIKLSEQQTWKRVYRNRLSTHRAGRAYLKKQNNITVALRSAIINKIMAILHEFAEKGYETFPLMQALQRAVAYLDRFCGAAEHTIYHDELQVIGFASVTLALKMQDPEELEEDFYASICAFPVTGNISVDMLRDKAKEIYRVLSPCDSTDEHLFGNVYKHSNRSFDNFNVSGCYVYAESLKEERFKELWPQFPINRWDDDRLLFILLKLLQLVDRDNENNLAFCLARYFVDLWLQSEFCLKYLPKTAAIAVFCFAMHVSRICSRQIWKPIVVKTINEYYLNSRDVFSAIKDLYSLTQAVRHIIVRYMCTRRKVPAVVGQNCHPRRLNINDMNIKDYPLKWW